ncbi:MAG: hypothetical protein IIY62_02625 [Kiritimatiellae bacterium]|nr:hypothetical protein [Kiritimatiellia bacterium]
MTHNTLNAAFGLGPIMTENNWTSIGPNRANEKAISFGPIQNKTNATQLDQRKPLFLLAILYVWSNLSKYVLVVIKNYFLIKNIIENFKWRARVRVHARNPIKRARARYSIRRILIGEPTGHASGDINRADPRPGAQGFPDPKVAAPIGRGRFSPAPTHHPVGAQETKMRI